MRRWKRLIYYLTINVLVSACTVVVVLSVWTRFFPTGFQAGEPTAQSASIPTPDFSSTGGIGSGGEPGVPDAVLETPEPVPTGVQEAEPEGEVTEYRVQPGDTLGAIAVRFNLTIVDLLEANDLVDPDRLEVGQTLTIPASEAPAPTHTAVPEEELETVEPSATPQQPDETTPAATGEARVIIDRVIGAGDLDAERVVLVREGAGELSLAGWQLSDGEETVFTFPQLTLFEGGTVDLYTQAGQGSVLELFWGLDAPVWSSGVEIVLLDNQGEVHATYEVP